MLEAGEPASLDALVRHLHDLPQGRVVMVDCTASDVLPDIYPMLLEQGVGVVTPNKRANTRDQDFYERLQALGRETPFYYETTVGAALPVIEPLVNLVRSGDRIQRIEGVLSGTLAFIFSEVAAGQRFSDAVRAARAAGYTEPDPRDDLGGRDAARKLLTLARESGLRAELDDVAVESLVPPALRDVPRDAFLERLDELDAFWEARRAHLPAGRKPVYLATMTEGALRVGVEAVGDDSPFYRLSGTDSMVAFTTLRYTRPLVVSGPGAGPDLTASGVLADVLSAALWM